MSSDSRGGGGRTGSGDWLGVEGGVGEGVEGE